MKILSLTSLNRLLYTADVTLLLRLHKTPVNEFAVSSPLSLVSEKNMSRQDELSWLVKQHGSPLLILDCDSVRTQYRCLQRALPGVVLHYALKPLPHPAVVSTLLSEGASFDLASSGEVDIVRDQGVTPDATIHTHPIKKDEDIRYALDYGCTTFVVDNKNEVDKFVDYRDSVELLLRVSFRNAEVFSDLSKKFGCTPREAVSIIRYAHKKGIRIKGLSFHVGSQTTQADKYVVAIQQCQAIMAAVQKAGLPVLNTLDIGGGFPVSYPGCHIDIDAFCAPIREALADLPDTLHVLAEPGRFIVAYAMEGVCSVMGQSVREGKPWYYLDDGVYGSFSGLIFDHMDYPIDVVKRRGKRVSSVLAGPTCDSIDVVAEDILLPRLKNGDLIHTTMLGAYSSATATDFNFIRRAKIITVNDVQDFAQTDLHVV